MATVFDHAVISPPPHQLHSFAPLYRPRGMQQFTAEPSTKTPPMAAVQDSFPFHILDLTRQLSAQTLEARSIKRRPSPLPRRLSSEPCRSSSPQPYLPTPPEELSSNPCPASSNATSTYNDLSTMCIRRQRQNALRDQCSTSHLEAISALVSRMIDNGEHCQVVPRPVDHLVQDYSMRQDMPPWAEANEEDMEEDLTEEAILGDGSHRGDAPPNAGKRPILRSRPSRKSQTQTYRVAKDVTGRQRRGSTIP